MIITHSIQSSTSSSGESSEVHMEVCTDTGQTELVISKTITERYPVTMYNSVMDLYNHLNRGSGRKKMRLKDF